MQTFLIIAKDHELEAKEIMALAGELKLSLLDFSLKKIADVRSLESLVALAFTRPTGIVIRRIDQATPEAANALLKILEEPQANIYYLLTAENQHSVLPTILSRCQIIKDQTKLQNKTNKNNHEILSFLDLPLTEKFRQIENLRQREEALVFLENLLYNCQQNLIKQKQGFRKTARTLVLLEKTRKALLQNGNVQLQLTNLLINL